MMSNLSEKDRQLYERYSHECMELAKRTQDPGIRDFLTEMATAWLKLAWGNEADPPR